MLDNVLKNEIKHEKVSFFQYLATSFLWAESVSPFFQYLFLYGSHIQLLAILYWGQFKFALPLGYNSFLEIIPKVTGILTCQSINSSTTSYEIGITLNIISYIYLLLFFLVVAFIITRFYSRKDISRRVRVLVNLFSHFHMTIGFWIINVILMNALSTAQNEESWEYGLISLDIFHFILIVFNYFIGIISAIFSFDPLSTSNILSSHSPVFQGLTFFLKAALAPITKIYLDSSFSAWYFVIFSLLVSSLKHYNILRTFPYYHYHPMKASIGFSVVSLLTAFTNLIVLIIKVKDEGSDYSLHVIFIQLFIIPFLLKFSNSELENNIIRFIEKKNYTMTNELQVIKKLFALNHLVALTSQSSNWSPRIGMAELQLWGALYSYKLIGIPKDSDLLKKDNVKNTFQELSENITQDLLVETARKVKSNKLRVILASKLSQNPKTINASLAYLSELSSNLGGLQHIIIKLYQSLQQKLENFYKGNEDALDIKSYVDQTMISMKFSKMLHFNGLKFVEFWEAYKKSDLKIMDSFKKSIEIENEDNKIRSFWARYIECDKKLASSMSFIYSIYLSLVRNAPYSAFSISETYPSFLSEKGKGNEDHLNLSETNIFSSRNIVFSVSMTKEKLGRVLFVSPNITNLTGWTTFDMIGNNINRIMTPEIKENHNQFLLKHLENISNPSYKSKLYQNLPISILSRTGKTLSCNLYLAVHPYVQQELVYVGFVRVHKSNKKTTTIESVTSRTFTERPTSKRSFHPLTKAFPSIEVTNFELLNTQVSQVNPTNTPFETAVSLIQKTKSRHLTLNQSFLHQTSINIPPMAELSFGSQINSKDLPSHDLNFYDEDDDEMKRQRLSENDDISEIPDEKNIVEIIAKGVTRSPPKKDHSNILIDAERREALQRKINLYDTNTSKKDKKKGQHNSESSKPILNSLSMHLSAQIKNKRQKIEHIIDFDKSVNGSLSSNPSSTKNYISKLEQGVYSIPKQPQIKALRLSVLFLALLATGLLILFGSKNNGTLNRVQGNIHVLSDSTLRLFRIVEVNRLTRIFPLIEYGLLSPQRYDMLFPGIDSRTLILPILIESTQELYHFNNIIMKSLNMIDKSLQPLFYEYKIPVKVLIIHPDGSVDTPTIAYANMFDLVTQIIAAESKIAVTPFDELVFGNEDVNMIILNSLNGLLVSGESVLGILQVDNEGKFHEVIHNLIAVTCLIGVLSSIIFGYFIWLGKDLTKRRNRIIDILLRLDERGIETRTILVNKYCQALEKEQGSGELNIRFDEATNLVYSKKAVGREFNIYKRKAVNLIGLNFPILVLRIYMIILLILITAAFFAVLGISVEQDSIIINKIQLMMDSNLNLYNVNLAFTSVYEHVYSNQSSTIRDVPIAEKWEEVYSILSKSQTYFLQLINSNEIDNSEEITELVRGNLCKIFYSESSDQICHTFSGGILTKGIIGGTSILTSTIRNVQESFDRSARDPIAMFTALNDTNLIMMDVIAELYLFPAFEKIDELIKDQLLKNVESYKTKFVLVAALFILSYVVVGLSLWIKIQRLLKVQRNGWRRMIRLIPHNMFYSNKMLKDYLLTNSDGILESVKRHLQ